MKKVGLAVLAVIAFLLAYLTLAPVPVEPAVWETPPNLGFTGDFTPNTSLAALTRVDIGEAHGPEDATVLGAYIYTTSQDGLIIRVDPTGAQPPKAIADTGGVPLGIEAGLDGVLYVADAHMGLVAVTVDGDVTVLTDTVDGSPIDYADDLDIADDGVIYFSDASTKFGAKAHGSTMAASLLEIMESRGTGRLLGFDPRTRQTRIVLDALVFSNGVAMHPDGSILVNETGRYRVLKVNPRTGAYTVFIDNLPGFPDNINLGPDGTFLLGLISPRSDWLDKNSAKPAARKVAMRLPPSMRPSSQPYGHIVQLNANGQVLRTFQDPAGAYHDATGGIVHDGQLYITSLHEPDLAVMPYPELN